MEKKSESFEKKDDGSEKDSKTHPEYSQSHDYIADRIELGNLRSTQSSPYRNLKLHHTRSFSEICHLHPSQTDLACVAGISPKLKVIDELQHEVRKPESVLEMVDVTSSESDNESEEDAIATQQKGDEALKKFLESNVNVPLDGAMTSSTSSHESLSSDVASENELIVGTWAREKRDSLASSNSSNLEKRFLTPSGLLLYREHQVQVDSMFDTKRLIVTPSSSSERPMSPLAMRKSDENVKQKTPSGATRSGRFENRRSWRTNSDSESDDNNVNKGSSVDKNDSEGRKRRYKVNVCDCDLKLNELKKVLRKYEVQCDELINRTKEQHNEIKSLRKDNVNLHKEHNRLQVVIRECHKNEEMAKRNIATVVKEKDKKIEQLRQTAASLEEDLLEKTFEVAALQNTTELYEEQGTRYVKLIRDMNSESRELMVALGKELGQETSEIKEEESPEAIVTILKTRRQSLSNDFKNFRRSSRPNGSDKIAEMQNRMNKDFQKLAAGCEDTLSEVDGTERRLGSILKRSTSLETFLKLKKANAEEAQLRDGGEKMQRLQSMNVSLVHENKVLQEDCALWRQRCEELVRQNEKRENLASKVRGKPLPSTELANLKNHIRNRRRSLSDTALQTPTLLPVSYTNPDEQEYLPATSAKAINKAGLSVGFHDLETRLKQLSQLTEDLTQKMEETNENFNKKPKISKSKQKQDLAKSDDADVPKQISFDFYAWNKLLSAVKGVYNEHLETLMDTVQRRENECRYLNEQLLMKESNEEITECYIDTLKRAITTCQDDLKNSKDKNQSLKRELRQMKDRVVVTSAEREMSLFYCKKNGVAKRNDFFNTEKEDDSEFPEELSFTKKYIKSRRA